MNRVSRLATAFCACFLFALVSHAQFTTSDPSPAQDPSASPFAQQGTALFAPSTDQIQNSGLGVRILFVGRNKDGKTLTISAELQNLTNEPIFVALVGPEPAAIDTSGITYEMTKIAGMARCKDLRNEVIRECFSNWNSYLPGAAFSLLQQGASAIVATTFAAAEVSTSGFLSVTLNVALARGSRPLDQRDTDSTIENVAISFPLVALTESK